ncbi:MAG: sulfotransferase [Xenococcus sp. (in: cyanobacteria)]
MFNLKVIHLVRDGRGACNSFRKNYGSFNKGMFNWIKLNIGALALKPIFKDEDWLEVKYEDFAQYPSDQMSRICDFIGVDYEMQMLNFRDHFCIALGGNLVRFRQDKKIYLDERWKEELSKSERIKFNIVAGWLNKIYGY